MKFVTVDQVMAWNPCGCNGPHDGKNYTRQRVQKLAAGRDTITPHDIAAAEIPIADKLWAIVRLEFYSDQQLHLLACDFAEHVVHLADSPASQAAIDTKRAWLRGEATDEELAAARAAAWAAAWDAAGAAARDAAGAAAWAAAGAAARDAARAAARAAAGAAEIEWQLAAALAAYDAAQAQEETPR